jgi:putative transposase
MGYDYARNGAYFITIVCQDRVDRFGEIVGGEMIMNDAGKMVRSVWDDLPKFHNGIFIDAFTVMPNHVHGIIVIDHDDITQNQSVGAIPQWSPGINDDDNSKPQNDELPYQNDFEMINDNNNSNNGRARGRRPYDSDYVKMSLSDVMNRFKSFTTHRYSNGVKMKLVPPFRKRLWQRDYWDHIIRNENEYQAIREYIINNPQSWEMDSLKNGDNELREGVAVYGDDWRFIC